MKPQTLALLLAAASLTRCGGCHPQATPSPGASSQPSLPPGDLRPVPPVTMSAEAADAEALAGVEAQVLELENSASDCAFVRGQESAFDERLAAVDGRLARPGSATRLKALAARGRTVIQACHK